MCIIYFNKGFKGSLVETEGFFDGEMESNGVF